jgi:tRNA(adenine34) deaminase
MKVLDHDEAMMRLALEQAKKAEHNDEVPVGAVVVLDGEIIAQAYNQPIARHDPTAHAEILALRAAGERVGNYRLTGATLYVTLEPCPMCAGAMVHARVGRLVYGAQDLRTGAAGSVFNLACSESLNHCITVTGNVLGEECAAQLRNFFQQRRKGGKAFQDGASYVGDPQ